MRQTQTQLFLPHSSQSCHRSWLLLPVFLLLLAALLAPVPLQAAQPSGKRLHIPVTVIPGLTAEIQSLRFYATDYGQQEYRRRKYATTFPASGIKYLNWEVILDHPFVRDEALRFRITAVLTGPDGKKLDTSETLAWIEPDADWTQWGKAFRVAAWKPGTYKVTLVIDKKELYQTSFQVVQAGEAPVRAADPLAILQLRVKNLRFYAGGPRSTPYYRAKFATDFQSRDTRQIWWVLDLQFLGQRSAPVTVPLEETWYGPGNRIIRQVSRKFTVPPHKKDWWWSARYGFNDPGKWVPGTYRVVIKVQGKTLAANSFKIEGPGVPSVSGDFLTQHHMKFVSFKFFEGPATTPKYGARSYGVKFPEASTRHIFWEFDVDVLKPAPAPVPFTITTFWYEPSGRLLKESAAHFILEKTTRRPWYTQGYGYQTPGHWKPGKYRVVLKINDQEVASGAFEITAAKKAAVPADFLKQNHLKFISLRFFAGPEERPIHYGTRKYQTQFAQTGLQYLHWEVLLKSAGTRPADVPFAIESFLYGPEGFVLKKWTFNFTLKKTYIMPVFAAPLNGNLLAGRWRPGKYRVVLKIKGQELAAGSFEIIKGLPFPLKK